MRIVEIEDNKVDKMTGYAEKMVHYGGKLLECFEELSERESIDQRYDDYDDDGYDDDDDMGQRGGRGGSRRGGSGGGMGQRRGVRGSGRSSRYR